MTRGSLISCRLAAPLVLICAGGPGQTAYTRTVKERGTVVQVELDRLTAGRANEPLREFQDVTVRVKVTDEASGSVVPGGSPAAWLDRKGEGAKTTAEQCAGKVKRFAEGSTLSRTEMDLTSFYVVLMNNDATLTVVDPRFGYGDTRLLALVTLAAPAEDWSLTADGKWLYVSMPGADSVAAIETATWRVSAKAAGITAAGRVALQPDEAYVWVGYGGNGGDSGVAAVSARDLKVMARIPTGQGYHHIAFSADSSYAFVTNPASGTVSVIDVRRLAKTRDIEVGHGPTWIAYSELAKAVYVSNEGDGRVTAIDATSHRVLGKMETAPGLGQIRFAPGGRHALAVNPANDHVYVIDAASNRVVQQGRLDKGPDRITFTNRQAHIRHRGSDTVLMIGLDGLGVEGTEISAADFPAGRNAPGDVALTTPADGIVQASGENGVLVANPKDKSVYFYMEGMAAPMGNFANYGREPRAVLSVDRNLRERAPGVYETTAKLPGAGSYDLALFLDRPRVVACVDVTIADDPASTATKPPKMKVEPRIAAGAAGAMSRMAFRLTTAESGQPDNGAEDVMVLVVGPLWQRRAIASALGDGVYAVEFVVPEPGKYSVFLSAASRGLPYAPYATMDVK